MTTLDQLLDDLREEGDRLRAVVAGLDADGWTTPTPAPGWTVATQVAHLAWTDEVAVLAAGSLAPQKTAQGKAAWDAVVADAMGDPDGFVDAGAHEVARAEPADLLARWDAARTALAHALRAVPPGQRLPWFGPPMSATSMATARFMETWAHALDVHEALGAVPEPTDRIRHVAHLGVRTRAFSFATRGLEVPPQEPRVELTAPSGDVWTWGPDDAEETVTGPAYDFCLLVTQRVHRDDTELRTVGDGAGRWLTIAQCFAGPPGEGRGRRG